MGINPVQFQKGLSMVEFMRRYGTQEKCHAAVVAQRWPDGFVCPECGESRHCTFERKGLMYWQCSACREQTAVLCGTVFESTKLPLSTWFLAMHLLTQAKNNVSALELKRHLGVRYKSAWLLKHKLMQVMSERDLFVHLADARPLLAQGIDDHRRQPVSQSGQRLGDALPDACFPLRHDFAVFGEQSPQAVDLGRAELDQLPAPEIEATVVAQIRTVLTSPESIASVVRHIQRNGAQIDEASTVMAMGRLNDVWDHLFPVERHRIANLMIERIDLVHIGEVQGIKVKWRELGWDKLIGEFAPKEIGAELMEVEA